MWIPRSCSSRWSVGRPAGLPRRSPNQRGRVHGVIASRGGKRSPCSSHSDATRSMLNSSSHALCCIEAAQGFDHRDLLSSRRVRGSVSTCMCPIRYQSKKTTVATRDGEDGPGDRTGHPHRERGDEEKTGTRVLERWWANGTGASSFSINGKARSRGTRAYAPSWAAPPVVDTANLTGNGVCSGARRVAAHTTSTLRSRHVIPKGGEGHPPLFGQRRMGTDRPHEVGIIPRATEHGPVRVQDADARGIKKLSRRGPAAFALRPSRGPGCTTRRDWSSEAVPLYVRLPTVHGEVENRASGVASPGQRCRAPLPDVADLQKWLKRRRC